MTSAIPVQDEITFDQFCEEWLREFTESDLPPFEKGQRFAIKLVTQWLDVNEDDEDLVLCDGTGDGGIDIAYLRRADVDDTETDDQSTEGDIWYLIQSKYGTSFQGSETVISEGLKVIATLCGENNRLSDATRDLLARLETFRGQASERDRIILVFATDQPITESDRQALNNIRIIGTERIGDIFDVEDVSLNTIWENKTIDGASAISLAIEGNFVEAGSGLRVGVTPLTSLYDFLKTYHNKTGNLDKLYEKNVRQFLGGRKKINKGIADTLKDSPENFGLYNNGITIVVSKYLNKSDGSIVLYDPYIVNGCQTTKTVWEVLRQRLNAGGTGQNAKLDEWRARAELGVVVTKIVQSDSDQISKITRYTNSQNTVRERDYLALRDDFPEWAKIMADRYDIFLEVQRGAWDSRRAYQKNNPSVRQFDKSANAFDLIKVYGAGWLREPGLAFGKTAPFLPNGPVFEQVTKSEPINADDLYAAYRLQQLTEQFKFGRGAAVPGRRQTKPLYYFVVIDLLKDVLIQGNQDYSSRNITQALLSLLEEDNQSALQMLLDTAIDALDEYMNPGSEDSLFKEPSFRNFNNDLNTFLKWGQLGKQEDATPHLKSLLSDYKRLMGRGTGGNESPRRLILSAIDSVAP